MRVVQLVLIELECKQSALCASQDLELTKAKAKAQEAIAQEAAIEAKAKARFSIEEQNWKLKSNYWSCLNVVLLCQVNRL